MKDATSELSTTVIAVVAIAAILAIFTVFLLPTLKSQIALTQACNGGPGYSAENVCCTGRDTNTGKYDCYYVDPDKKNVGSDVKQNKVLECSKTAPSNYDGHKTCD